MIKTAAIFALASANVGIKPVLEQALQTENLGEVETRRAEQGAADWRTNGINQIKFCARNPADARCQDERMKLEVELMMLKVKMADQTCTLLGKLHSLQMGVQMNLAKKSESTYNGMNGEELVDGIMDGTVDEEAIDKHWINVVGNQAQFGENQWDLAYMFARSKGVMNDALAGMFGVIDGYAAQEVGQLNGGNTRRLGDDEIRRRTTGYFGDGYVSNKAGSSTVMNELDQMGAVLAHCDQWLQNKGSGLKNAGESCADPCTATGLDGACSYCGTGKCCKKGVSQAMGCNGGQGGNDRYVCVSSF